MTAPDPRVGEIEARLANLKQGPWELHSFGASDVSYLLAELRKAHEALARVRKVSARVETAAYALRAAVAASNGDARG